MCLSKTSASPFWKGMSTDKNNFFLGIMKEANNRRGIRFWQDNTVMTRQMVFDYSIEDIIPDTLF